VRGVRRAAGAASWLHLHAQIQARRAGCICMRRYRRGELVAFVCADTGAASWLHSRGALRCTGCEAMRCDARDALREPMRCELVAVACADTDTMLLTEGFLGWGVWAVKPRFYKDKVFKVDGVRYGR
jgi:hypothetical protein